MSSTRFNPPFPTLEQVVGTGKETIPDADASFVPGENDLASSTTKKTLRSYISSLTRGQAPTVITSDDSGVFSEAGVIEYNGPDAPPHRNAFALGDGENTQDEKFAKGDLSGYSNSGLFDGVLTDKGLQNIVNKGSPIEGIDLSSANGDDPLSGHKLLQGVTSSPNGVAEGAAEGSSVYLDAIPGVLSDNNLNHPGDKFNINDGRVSVSMGEGMLSRSTSPTQAVPGNNLRIEIAALKEVAERIMLSAAGKNPGDGEIPSAEESGNTSSAVQQGRSRVDTRWLAPQFAKGIGGLNSTTAGVDVDIGVDEDERFRDGNEPDRYTVSSYGAVYHPGERFESGNSTSESFQELAVTAYGIVTAVIAVVSPIGTASGRTGRRLVQGQVNVVPSFSNLDGRLDYNLSLNPEGRFSFDEKLNVSTVVRNSTRDWSDDGVNVVSLYKPTNSLADYGICATLGFASFIGVAYGEDDTLNLLGDQRSFNFFGLERITNAIGARYASIASDGLPSRNRGYYMSVFREIVKESANLVGETTGNSPTLDIRDIRTFANNKVVRFVDTMARIGDMILLQQAATDIYKFNLEGDVINPYAEGGFKPTASDLEAAIGEVVDEAITAATEAVGGFFGELAGGSSGRATGEAIGRAIGESFTPPTSPSPASMKKFASRRIRGVKIAGQRGSYLGVADLPSAHLLPRNYASVVGDEKKLTSYTEEAKSASGRTNLRIPRERVAQLEDVLDAEYMPFYFHDLRTNEIISFHAFLEDLNDSYTANYNSTSAYGRVESIHNYKDTKRSVGCTFQIVAMNQDDFDYMWWQINKLTTMVYPQWSQGRAAQVGSTKFVQPFSQIPNATPVIRLRVGDLIRSNYSRFNLKRIFGYMDDENRQYTGLNGKVFFLKPGTYAADDGSGMVRVDVPLRLGVIPPPRNGNSYLIAIYPDIGNPLRKIRFYRSDCYYQAQSSDNGAAITQFYDPANNAIVRSFESSMGQGLAAVVTQLQFTWLDNQTVWGAGEDGPGYRAPRSCKVQMNFEPIHDIAPGLDHQGLNRAPIYPVGGLVNSLVEAGEKEPYGAGTARKSEWTESSLPELSGPVDDLVQSGLDIVTGFLGRERNR